MITTKPITRNERFKQQVAECEDWFKDHEASIVLSGNDTIVLSFRNPKSWVYGIRIVVHSQWLCIMGDIGECIHQWSGSLTLEFLAGCDFHYYIGKCQASDDFRRNGSTWDSGVALDFLLDQKRQDDGTIREVIQDLEDSGCYTREEFEGAAHAIYNTTGDSELASDFSQAGEVPSAQAIGRWVGLKKAIEQLRKQPPV